MLVVYELRPLEMTLKVCNSEVRTEHLRYRLLCIFAQQYGRYHCIDVLRYNRSYSINAVRAVKILMD